MLKHCLKCGHANPDAAGAEFDACPDCGAIYSRVEAAMAAKAAAARAQKAGPTIEAASTPDPVSSTTPEKVTKGPTTIKTVPGLIIIVLVSSLGMWVMSEETTPKKKINDASAYVQCKNFVRERLRSPATADFPFMEYTSWDMGNDTWVVKSHVDSQNGLGAMLRSNWHCKVQYVGGNTSDQRSWRPLSIDIQ
ncbi:hypothetical protein YS110_01945 [Acidovorax sp. YS12]|nr:hypothetical protein YS110_01945 [Acidovorax sp. YS12]